MTITINNKEVTLKKTFRSVIAYELAMKKPFNPTTLSETIMYFYCVIISSDTELEITYDDFITWLDNNETSLKNFTEWVIKVNQIEDTTAKKKSVRTTKKSL